jgi:hypothetical protein
MWHAIWRELTKVGEEIEAGGGGPGVTDHADLTNVTPNQHHNQTHTLYGADHSDVDTTDTPVAGDVLMFDGAKWGPFNSLAAFVSAGYGGVVQSVSVGISDMGAGYQTLPADTVALTTPENVVQDVSGNGLRFSEAGIWHIDVSFSVSHDELNAGRAFEARLYNATDVVAAEGVPIGVGRNQGVTNFSTGLIVEITPEAINDLFTMQIGGGDTFSSVTLEGYRFSTHHVSEYQGEIAPPVVVHALWDDITKIKCTLADDDHQVVSDQSDTARCEGTIAKDAADTFSLEYTVDAVGDAGGSRCFLGFRSGSAVAPADGDRMWWRGNGQYQMQGTNSAAGAWPTYTTGDILTFVFVAGDLWVRVNGGAWVGGGDPDLSTTPSFSGLTGTEIRASFSSDNAGVYPDITMNAGDRAFSHMPASFTGGMQ